MIPNVGEIWRTGPWRDAPREIEIESTLREVLADEEVRFFFVDESQPPSRCSTTAFLKTYEFAP